MRSRPPASQEIEDLVSFLPKLYAEGFAPVKGWHGGSKTGSDALTVPWPEYHPLVERFFRVAGNDCWSDYGYHPEEAGRMLQDPDLVKNASLSQIKTMLTYCVRGERFGDGHWAEMIEKGHIRRLLERLAVLGSVNIRTAPGGS